MIDKYFEENFDISEYIAKRTLEMNSLPERSIYKEITQNMLIDLYEYHQKSYQNLCNDIMNELDPIVNENPIYIGISRECDYDETNDFLYPMQETDFFKKKFSITDIKYYLEEEGTFDIGNLYFGCSLQTLNKLKETIDMCDGKILTSKGEYPAKFKVSFNDIYLNKLTEIYEAFKFNQKKWLPICTAYLMRFFKIELYQMDGDVEGEYEGIDIEFIKNYDCIQLDIFPTWNITKLSEPTSIYPKPVKEKMVYEHKIFSHFLNDTSTYFLASSNPDVLQVTRNKGDLLIRTPKEEAIEWALIEVKPFKHKSQKGLILSNEYAYKVIDMFLQRYKSSVKTKAELSRFLKNLPFTKYIEFKDFEVVKFTNEVFETYNMDIFELDEIRTEYEKTMILSFIKLDDEHILTSDFMSFYVTQVQKLFPEYKCVGKFI